MRRGRLVYTNPLVRCFPFLLNSSAHWLGRSVEKGSFAAADESLGENGLDGEVPTSFVISWPRHLVAGPSNGWLVHRISSRASWRGLLSSGKLCVSSIRRPWPLLTGLSCRSPAVAATGRGGEVKGCRVAAASVTVARDRVGDKGPVLAHGVWHTEEKPRMARFSSPLWNLQGFFFVKSLSVLPSAACCSY